MHKYVLLNGMFLGLICFCLSTLGEEDISSHRGPSNENQARKVVDALILKLAERPSTDFTSSTEILKNFGNEGYDAVIEYLGHPDYSTREAAMSLLLAAGIESAARISFHLHALPLSLEQRWRLAALSKALTEEFDLAIATLPNLVREVWQDEYGSLTSPKTKRMRELYKKDSSSWLNLLQSRLEEARINKDLRAFQLTLTALLFLAPQNPEVVSVILREVARKDWTEDTSTNLFRAFFTNPSGVFEYGERSQIIELLKSDEHLDKRMGKKLLGFQLESRVGFNTKHSLIKEVLDIHDPEIRKVVIAAFQKNLAEEYNYTSLLQLIAKLGAHDGKPVIDFLISNYKSLDYGLNESWQDNLVVFVELLRGAQPGHLEIACAILPSFPTQQLLDDMTVREGMASDKEVFRQTTLEILVAAKNPAKSQGMLLDLYNAGKYPLDYAIALSRITPIEEANVPKLVIALKNSQDPRSQKILIKALSNSKIPCIPVMSAMRLAKKLASFPQGSKSYKSFMVRLWSNLSTLLGQMPCRA